MSLSLDWLHPRHQNKLRGSGLRHRAVSENDIYTETSPQVLARLLNWPRPATAAVPALVFPYWSRRGEDTGFVRVRPWTKRPNGGKYEQPKGVPPRAYFPFGAWEAVRTPGTRLLITEGELKSLAITQAGIPCVGLGGVWGWMRRRERDDKGRPVGDRVLIDDLAGVDWRGRPAGIVFDRDSVRKPEVHHAAAELARVLSGLGAVVRIIYLPPEPGPGGYLKQGADDFIVRHGAKTFVRLVEAEFAGHPTKSLEEFREELVAARVSTLHRPGVNLDRSPPGAGKSRADVEALGPDRFRRSLSIVPTHANCEEVEREFGGPAVGAVSYPRLSNKSCQRHAEAVGVIRQGLSFQAVLCPECPHREGCPYRERYDAARQATHSIATHRRAEMSLPELAKKRDYITIHEVPEDLVRPLAAVKGGFRDVARLAAKARRRAKGCGEEMKGHVRFFRQMRDIAASVGSSLASATTTLPVALPVITPAPKLKGIDRLLYEEIEASGIRPPGDALGVVKAAAAGELVGVTVQVERYFGRGGKERTRRCVVAVWKNQLPADKTVWVNDATADPDEIRAMSGLPVEDKTPSGTLAPQHPVVQVAGDVTKRTSARGVVDTMRAVLAGLPGYKRIGVITHKKHVPVLLGSAKDGPKLGSKARRRLVMVEHFRGGRSRGSNEWLGRCDVLVILGTPRVPPEAVSQRLIRVGKVEAAGRPGDWADDYWSGVTLAGRRVTVRTRGYRDHDRHEAHTRLVIAELIQCVGRGRAVCEDGIPVLVVSRENLGLPLADVEFSPLTESHRAVLRAVRSLQGGPRRGLEREGSNKPSRKNLGNTRLIEHPAKGEALAGCSITTPARSKVIATRVGVSQRRVITILNALAARGLVVRVGQRGGWRLPEGGSPCFFPRPGTTPHDRRPESCSRRSSARARSHGGTRRGTTNGTVPRSRRDRGLTGRRATGARAG